jgi:hypothetical protein
VDGPARLAHWCEFYLPTPCLTSAQRARGHTPPAVVFQEKWRQAFTSLRQVRALGITVTAVVVEAEFGDCTPLRSTLHTLGLPYTVGVSSHLTVWLGTPRTERPPRRTGRGAPHPVGAWRPALRRPRSGLRPLRPPRAHGGRSVGAVARRRRGGHDSGPVESPPPTTGTRVT